MDNTTLRTTIYNSILDLATEDGINASGRGEVYGCIFGRDSAVTILKILKVLRSESASSYYEVFQLQQMCRKALIRLTELQGKKTNPESGEEPGKFIHEYRTSNYERLLKLEKPWYVYPDGILRNYDSLDSTPMGLIAIYRYWEQTKDNEFLLKVLPAVEAGLNWIITYGDTDKDQLVEYELSPLRKHGGLPVQSWTDSHTCLLDRSGKMPLYPIAPVEVQGYMWLALKLWADFYMNASLTVSHSEKFARKLLSFAEGMKKQFNKMFLLEDSEGLFLAQALDGEKNQLSKITGNPLLVLWASYIKDGKTECILDEVHIPGIVKRAFKEDLFDPHAGIRTMSTKTFDYNAGRDSYHNGSFWPKLNGMSHEGLVHWEFEKEATLLKEATLKPIRYFGTPIELYIKNDDGTYHVYLGEDGQEGCRNQAWSAAVALDLLTT